jgi:hypothetical protein
MPRLIPALLLLTALAAHTQTPAHTPPQTPSTDWATFAASTPPQSEVTIISRDRKTTCRLDAITPGFLTCHLNPGPFRYLPFTLPVQDFQFPRPAIVEVRRPNRSASAFLGFAIGFGIGTAAAFANHNNTGADRTGAIVLGAGSLGLLGSYIGHSLPCIHHTLYRTHQPQPTHN